MKYETLRDLLLNEKFHNLTVKQFVKVIQEGKLHLLDDGVPEFLKEGFEPTNVTHYTNHDKGADIVDEEEVEDEAYSKASFNAGEVI